MWNLQYSNRICQNQAKIREQLRHLEGLISTKTTIDNSVPFKPSFFDLKYKFTKNQEIKKEKITKENMKFQKRLQEIHARPSSYNKRNLSPKRYPAFDKSLRSFNYDKKIRDDKIKKDNRKWQNACKTIKGEFDNEALYRHEENIENYKRLLSNKNNLKNPSMQFETPESFITKIRTHLLYNQKMETRPMTTLGERNNKSNNSSNVQKTMK